MFCEVGKGNHIRVGVGPEDMPQMYCPLRPHSACLFSLPPLSVSLSLCLFPPSPSPSPKGSLPTTVKGLEMLKHRWKGAGRGWSLEPLTSARTQGPFGPLPRSQSLRFRVVQGAPLGKGRRGARVEEGAGGGDAGTFPWVMVSSRRERVPEAGAAAWVTAVCLRVFLPPRGF